MKVSEALPDIQPQLKKPKRKYTKRKKPEDENKEPAASMDIETVQVKVEKPLTVVPETLNPYSKISDSISHHVDDRLQTQAQYLMDAMRTFHETTNTSIGNVTKLIHETHAQASKAISELHTKIDQHSVLPPKEPRVEQYEKQPDVFFWDKSNRKNFI